MSARRRAAARSVGKDLDEANAVEDSAPVVDIDMDTEAFLRAELAAAYHARSEAKPGSQAYFAGTRLVKQFREELDAYRVQHAPTARLDAVGILDQAQEFARGLPEAVLVVFANEWARRHRAMWVPMDPVPTETPEEDDDDDET